MNSMFQHTESLAVLDISNFDTSQVTDMSCMFSDNRGITSLDLRHFNTKKVVNMNIHLYV